MYNFNYNFDTYDLEKYFNSIPSWLIIFLIFFLIVLVLAIIVAYVFSSLGLMETAKKNNIDNAWLAFIPIGRHYLIGKLGYEVYAEEGKNNASLVWVTFGLSIASFLLNNYLVSVALMVFTYIAFYNIFKAVTEKYKMYTVFTVLFGDTLGGIFLYVMRGKLTNMNSSKKTLEKENIEEKEEIKEETKTARPKYCPECGNKLNTNANFCTNCGKKIK